MPSLAAGAPKTLAFGTALYAVGKSVYVCALSSARISTVIARTGRWAPSLQRYYARESKKAYGERASWEQPWIRLCREYGSIVLTPMHPAADLKSMSKANASGHAKSKAAFQK
jgi:hypothetical protein